MKRALIILASIAVIFAAATWIWGMPQGGLYNSPDETANAFWITRLAALEPLEVRDEAVGLGAGAVHPRSLAVSGDRLVPGSFPGIFIVFGALRTLTRLPPAAMTPLITAIAGLMLFGVVRRFFGERVAFWSAVLFYVHPAVLYYSGRGLFHNVLFVDLLIMSAWVLLWTRFRFLGGVLFGLALITRASEAVWAVPLALAIVIVYRRKVWKTWITAVIGAMLPLVLWAALNMMFYGSPLRTAYVPPSIPASAVSGTKVPGTDVPGTQVSGTKEADTLLPFGFHPRNIWRHGFDYGLGIFWWYAVACAIGFLIVVHKWRSLARGARLHAIVTVAVGAWLAVLYGSWYVRDNLDPNLVTIGTSYVRYFLPVYVLALPWAAEALVRAASYARRPYFIAAAAVLFAVLGLRIAVFEGEESLLAVRSVLVNNAAKKPVLLAAIPPETVIMTQRFDKVVFPERLRIIPLDDEGSWAAAGRLTDRFPVAWYGLDPSEEEWAALKVKAERAGMEVAAASSLVPGELLVTLIPRP